MSRQRFLSDLHWVRNGQQSRSQKTQESLLEAAAILFAEKGADATSVADVAQRAGCSVGSVYHHFRDKQTLRYAVFERAVAESSDAIQRAVDPSRWTGASIEDVLRGYLEYTLEIGRNRPAFKSAMIEVSRDEPTLRERRAGLQAEVGRGVASLLLERREEIGHSEPELAVDFVLDQLASLLRTRLDEMLLPTRLANQRDEVFVEEALRSVREYLKLDE